MSGKIKVILNGYAGVLDKQAKTTLIEQTLRAAGLDYRIENTLYPDHATELAQQAGQEKWSVVVAAGGDGTINEVANGLLRAAGNQQPCPLGIIPMGTANDFADALAIPDNARAACQRIARGNTRSFDVGRVNGRYFVNNSAVGLESVVTLTQDNMRWIKGNLRYVLAAMKTVLTAKPWQMRLEWDAGVFEGPVILVSVGNTRRTGGAFFMTPAAKPDDGLLDFIYGMGMSRLQMLALLPKTFSGSHVHHSLVGYLQTRRLSITASPPTPIQVDGEVIEQRAERIEYEIIPNRLQVIV